MYHISASFFSACGYSPIKCYSAKNLLLLTPQKILDLASKSPSKDIRDMLNEIERLPLIGQDQYIMANAIVVAAMLPDVARSVERDENNKTRVRPRSF